MASRRLTSATVAEVRRPARGNGSDPESADPGSPGIAAALPAALVLLLLLAATLFDGAFQTRHWAPVTLLALAMLAATVAAGGVPRLPAWARLTLVSAWGLAAWSVLSLLWSPAPGSAFEGGGRMVMYAALVSFPLLTGASRRHLRRLGHALIAGLAALALITLARILIEGEELFLAGRLDAPVGYRNATAALFALGVWPLVCLGAVRGTNAPLRAGATATAALCLGLAFLTQSRGMLVGLVAGGLVALLLGPDRIRRAWLAVMLVVLVAAASPLLLEPYDAFDGGQGTVSSGDVATAGWALLALTVGAFFISLLLYLFDNGLREQAHVQTRRIAAVALAGGVLVAAAGVAATIGNPVDFSREKLDEFRSLETSSTGETRLGSVSGQRYDLWRIAWNEFTEHPVAGAGVGSYETAYYAERSTDRNLSNPHSWPLRVLAETGVVGLGLFAAMLAGLLWPLATALRRGVERDLRAAAGLAAAGATLVAQTFVDWLTFIPGVTGLGLLALALAAAIAAPERAPATRPRAAGVAGAAALGVAGVVVLSLFVSDLYVREAREQGSDSPQAQVDAAETAAQANPWAMEPLWLQASALESLGRPEDARAKLLEALEQEPESFSTLALLGDLEARAGNVSRARAYYQRALALNPRDVGLRELAAGQFGG